MVSNDDFDGKATHLNCFYLQINFEQKYPKPAIVIRTQRSIFNLNQYIYSTVFIIQNQNSVLVFCIAFAWLFFQDIFSYFFSG